MASAEKRVYKKREIMNFCFHPGGTWAEVNSRMTQQLGLDAEASYLTAFSGIHHGLMEVVQAAYKQFPHKKGAHFLMGGSPYFEPIQKFLSMDAKNSAAYDLKKVSVKDNWVQNLGREDVFVAMPMNHPLTGEIFPLQELDEWVQSKKVVSIKLYHGLPSEEVLKSPLGRHELRLFYISPSCCFSLAGVRAKFMYPLSQDMFWDGEAMIEGLQRVQSFNESQAKVQKAESLFAEGDQGIQSFFSQKVSEGLNLVESRQWDRALFLIKDTDAAAVIGALARAPDSGLNSENIHSFLQTPSLSQWKDLRAFQWAQSEALTATDLRELLLVDPHWADGVDFKNLLVEAVKKVRSLQGQRIKDLS